MITRLSDLASGLMLQGQGARMKAAFAAAGSAVSSGLKPDLAAATGGDYRNLFSIDNELSRIESRTASLTLSLGRAEATGRVLEHFREAGDTQAPQLVAAAERGDMASLRIEAGNSLLQFQSAVAALNTTLGGRTLLAGTATDRPATISADQMLQQLEALTAGAPDAATVQTLVEDYFLSPAGGYATGAYQGATMDVPQAAIAPGDQVKVQLRADDPAIRQGLRDLAMVALVARGTLAASPDEQRNLVSAAGTGMLAGQAAIVALRSDLGHAEERVADAISGQAAEKSALNITRNGIVVTDPYEAAAEFQALEGQLQSHYLVTSRLSQMSLMQFLR